MPSPTNDDSDAAITAALLSVSPNISFGPAFVNAVSAYCESFPASSYGGFGLGHNN